MTRRPTPNTTKDILRLSIFGTPTPGYELLIEVFQDYLKRARIDFKLDEYNRVSDFIANAVPSVPAVQVGHESIRPMGNNGDFNQSVRKILLQILKKYDFGMLPKILIPVDFSASSINAFSYGLRMATDTRSVVKATHVFYPSANNMNKSIEGNDNVVKNVKQELLQFVDKFHYGFGEDLKSRPLIDPVFETGFPAEKLLEMVKTNQPKLLIMGTKGKTNLGRKLFGSVSGKMMQQANCPVIVVPEKAGYRKPATILFAYDGKEQDASVLKQLTEFAGQFDAAIHIVHIDKGDEVTEMEGMLQLVDYPSEKITTAVISSSNISSSIKDYATMHRVDMIAMSTNEKSFFDRMFKDSMTQEMTTMSKVPLIILKKTD